MRRWIAVAANVNCLISGAACAADTYPSRPIRIIILVVPGGGADITTRAVGQKPTEAWGQRAIVDNRPGGNGAVGMEIAKNANPDGRTLVLGTVGPVAVNPSLYAKLPYDFIKDFTPVARAVSALNVLVVHPALPVKSELNTGRSRTPIRGSKAHRVARSSASQPK
jgi:tripartite-type tricarboxylate transporter receptor subunit TctC